MFDGRRRIRIRNLLRGLHLKLLRGGVSHPFCQAGLALLRENIFDRYGWEVVGVGARFDCALAFGRSSFFLCPRVSSWLRLILLREFNECCKSAVCNRK